MDYLDFIRELRKGGSDPKKAEKAMKILGWICIFGAIWNFVLYYVGPFNKSPFNLPPSYPYLGLISLSLLGTLFLHSARGIKERASWGKKSGQLAVVLLIGLLFGFMYFAFSKWEAPFSGDKGSIIFNVFFAVFFAQFMIPAYFGVRYLGRLPVKDSTYDQDGFKYEAISKTSDEEIGRESSLLQTKYKDALLPFGIIGTSVFLIGLPLLIIFVLEKYYGPGLGHYLFMPMFLFIFFGPVVYNYIPSSFQKERSVVASYTGGGSILSLGGSWPFFRLMVYDDGVEVRTMFHRYFIPYNKMADISDKIGFFSRGLLIKSDLPGVPSSIRFNGFGMKRIVKMLNEMRTEYLARIRKGKGGSP